MLRRCLATAVLAAPLAAPPASAQELFGGVYVHAVDTPFTLDTGEQGTDIEAGYRFAPIEGLAPIGKPSPYVIVSVNTASGTSFAGAGLSWKIGKGPVYLRPGIGLVVNDTPSYRVDPVTGYRTDLGSRVLFEPELAIGTRISPRLGIEASWVHISHARLFNSQQNPGIDMMGLRLTYRMR
ncbi:MAG: acyloxyacyl hydrolase [Novosphingobium sp.]